jgi:hypothetical protein
VLSVPSVVSPFGSGSAGLGSRSFLGMLADAREMSRSKWDSGILGF